MSREPLDLEKIRVRTNVNASTLINTVLILCDEIERLRHRLAQVEHKETAITSEGNQNE